MYARLGWLSMNEKRLHTDNGEPPVFDNDNRIDWERKQKKRKARRNVRADAPVVFEEDALELQSSKKRKRYRKKRQLIYDEDLGHVVVKRRRRPNRLAQDGLDEWD